MDNLLHQRWMRALTPAMTNAEAEACFHIYKRWLEDRKLPMTETDMQAILNRLQQNEPLQYILGEAWFYGMALKVNRHTLIPRPETEELCDLILKNCSQENLRILDIGTGSGCIPITLIKNRKSWKATAIDIDRSALDLAHENAVLQGVSDRVSLVHANFIEGFTPNEKWDLIVSNPPYIDMVEKDSMESTVLDWEPHTALFPMGNDSLIFYKKLADLLFHQNMNCIVWAEINPLFATETLALFEGFSKKELINDMSGKLRFIHVTK
jgi:release factor glutamine methyltransferase